MAEAEQKDVQSERMGQYKELFATVDSNSDGSISAQEFREAFSKNSGFRISFTEVQTIMSCFDTNNDGGIDYGEFVAMMDSIENNKFLQQVIAREYKKIGGTTDGLKKSDFKKFFKMTENGGLSDAHADKMYELAVQDGGAQIITFK